jgi:hypothetical protein
MYAGLNDAGETGRLQAKKCVILFYGSKYNMIISNIVLEDELV